MIGDFERGGDADCFFSLLSVFVSFNVSASLPILMGQNYSVQTTGALVIRTPYPARPNPQQLTSRQKRNHGFGSHGQVQAIEFPGGPGCWRIWE
jgi:hypothetical protein